MLLGENGSGKTTLIKALLQMIPVSSGNIYYDTHEITSWNEKTRAKVFSYVPQIKELVDHLTVEDCILAGCTRRLSLFAMPSSDAYTQVDHLMKHLGIASLKGKLLQEISGGELQMVYLARAFFQDSEVLLLDEPCTYLDFRRQHLFLNEVIKMKEQEKSTIISIHDPNLALQYGDEILFLHQGKLIAHLKKEKDDLPRACCALYNEVYGAHFTCLEDEKILIWKEN